MAHARAAQRLLRWLPGAIAARLLTAAIARHAWTFAGSGRFAAAFHGGLRLSLTGAPLCTDAAPTGSAYLAATFETIFAAMLGPDTRVREVAGIGSGASCCGFIVIWSCDTTRRERHVRPEPASRRGP